MKLKQTLLPLVLCGCITYNNQEYIQGITQALEKDDNVVDVIKLYYQYNNCQQYHPQNFELCQMIAHDFSEPDIDLACADENIQSDECILYRRTIPKSQVRYFDYKRLLGENSIIKTDAEFLHLVAYYNQIDKDCDSMPEKTTVEKQECKDQKIATLQRMVHERIKCSELVPQEYEDFIINEKGYYDGQLSQYKTCIKSNCGDYDFKGTFRSAKESIANSAEKFSERHMCEADNWESKVFNK